MAVADADAIDLMAVPLTESNLKIIHAVESVNKYKTSILFRITDYHYNSCNENVT